MKIRVASIILRQKVVVGCGCVTSVSRKGIGEDSGRKVWCVVGGGETPRRERQNDRRNTGVSAESELNGRNICWIWKRQLLEAAGNVAPTRREITEDFQIVPREGRLPMRRE